MSRCWCLCVNGFLRTVLPVLHATEGGAGEEIAVGYGYLFVGGIVERHEIIVLDVLEGTVVVDLGLVHCGADEVGHHAVDAVV